ncbi:MAG: M28 family peptidase [Promethearchaeota archaeon]
MLESSFKYFSTDFVRKLSFPRLAGSDGEQKAQELIESELKRLGIDAFEKEPFNYTTFFMNVLLRFYNPLIGLLMIFIYLSLHFKFHGLTIVLTILLFILSWFGRQIREKIQFTFRKIGKLKTSFNYIIKLQANKEEEKNKKNIVLFAHYDSISHEFHPLFAGAIYLFSLLGGSIFSVHVIIVLFLFYFNFVSDLILIQFIYSFFLAGFYGIQLFNRRHNKSSGTADNATGVACALYLADYFNKNRLKYLNLIIVLTGAEEMGDYGAYSFIKTHCKEFEKTNSFFLIFDTLGSKKQMNFYAWSQGLLPRHVFSPTLNKHLQEFLEKKGVNKYKIKPFAIPPFIHYSTDHAPLKPLRYEFLVFFSNAPIHSSRDNLQNYSPEMLEDFNRFMTDFILHLDEKL